ncbi:MAG: hypothetical protein P4L56_15630 [Candidatus Sulfopaludibacter sp.]|nr:hypothetical protein [Candidatus Sulfopaludibacter sp.]
MTAVVAAVFRDIVLPRRIARSAYQTIADWMPVDVGFVWVVDPETLESILHTAQGRLALPDATLRIPGTPIEIPLRQLEEEQFHKGAERPGVSGGRKNSLANHRADADIVTNGRSIAPEVAHGPMAQPSRAECATVPPVSFLNLSRCLHPHAPLKSCQAKNERRA